MCGTYIQAYKALNGVKEIHQQVPASGELGHTAETKVGARWVKVNKEQDM